MNTQALRTQNHAAFSLSYHIIFTTKYRRKCITAPMLDRLEISLSDVLAKWKCRLIEFGGEADHVHLLIEAHPALDLSRLVGNLKAVSSRHVRSGFEEHLATFYRKPVFWNKAYAVISVGSRANLETLITYIQDQEVPLD